MPNSSRNPNQVLLDAELKGYSRILFQQGKPVCDFELTLLGDLANPQRLAAQYIGSGVPAGSDGFAITDLNVVASDFTIQGGRCLVNGKEVFLADKTTYKKQPHPERVKKLPAGKSNVYLRVFPTEISDKEDENLGNKNDVGTVTALREKTDWEVLVSAPTINQPDHFLLATIETGADPVKNVSDRRRRELTMASLRDQFDSFAGVSTGLAERLNASLNPNGTLKENVVGNAQLANNAVTTNEIVDGSVIGTKLAVNAVNETNLTDNAVSKRTIQDGSVIGTKLAVNAVNETNLTDNAVSKRTIQDGSVIGTKLAVNAVNETNLTDNAVSKRTIQDGAISMTKLAPKPILESEVSVPRATVVSVPNQPPVVIPGERVLGLQNADEHAFYLISVRLVSPRPSIQIQLGGEVPENGVRWTQRSVGSTLGNQSLHQHQLILQNFNPKLDFTVACKAFRITDV